MNLRDEQLPNLLRGTATLIRLDHGPACPDRQAWESAARLLDRVAAAEETGARLRAGERDTALQVARSFLAPERADVDAPAEVAA